jgi:hypothetical protein
MIGQVLCCKTNQYGEDQFDKTNLGRQESLTNEGSDV